jgi:hypothetical protein
MTKRGGMTSGSQRLTAAARGTDGGCQLEGNNDLALCLASAEMVPPHQLSTAFAELAVEAELPGTLHTLRHTAASVLLRS